MQQLINKILELGALHEQSASNKERDLIESELKDILINYKNNKHAKK